MTDTVEPKLPQEIAPAPDGHAYLDLEKPADDLARQMLAHHAARAWAFHQAAERDAEGTIHWPDATMHLLAEYQLAKLWWFAYAADSEWPNDINSSNEMAREIVTDLASPQVLASEIETMLRLVGIDPATVAAFGIEGEMERRHEYGVEFPNGSVEVRERWTAVDVADAGRRARNPDLTFLRRRVVTTRGPWEEA